MLGMGKFNVKKAQLHAKCPITTHKEHSVAKSVKTMILSACEYHISGMQLDENGEGKDEITIKKSIRKWARFNSEVEVNWGYLEIETKPLSHGTN